MAQNTCTFLLPIISNISVGHLNDPTSLSAAVLGSSFFMVCVRLCSLLVRHRGAPDCCG